MKSFLRQHAFGAIANAMLALAIFADKAYDSDKIRKYISDRGSITVIPPPSNLRQSVDYRKALSKTRHETENFFAGIKRYRCISKSYAAESIPIWDSQVFWH